MNYLLHRTYPMVSIEKLYACLFINKIPCEALQKWNIQKWVRTAALISSPLTFWRIHYITISMPDAFWIITSVF